MSQERPFETELETAVAHAPAQTLPARARSRAELWAREYGLEALALIWILAFAFTLRTVNVNWDRNQHLHPDERFLAIVSTDIRIPGSVGEYFDSTNSPLNPYNRSEGATFVYGTFPLFLNKITAEWLDRDADGSTHQTADWLFNTLGVFGVGVDRPDGGRVFDGGYNSNLVGRVLSAIFDTLTVLLVYELGRFLYGRRAGLVAAGLLSVTVLHLQYSHFFGSETFAGFFATAVVYFSARIWKRGDWWDYLGAGVALGLAIACKLSVLPVLLVIALAVLMRIGPGLPPLYYRIVNAIDPRGVNSGEQVPWRGLILPTLGGFGSLLVAGFVFRIFQPYAFAGPGFFDVIDFGALARGDILHLTHWVKFDDRFVRDIDALRETQTGTDFPPNIQWIGRTPFVFPLVNMVFWGLGIFLSAAVALGIGRG
ncbi:MAG TPA: glycosyltransferase family 39 protein, partial [Tepidiformaceae bacterium]|nr:glycosyltransferase family 39 protein [Tepidiformaceae bacterium]